jgi:hypothetical protein
MVNNAHCMDPERNFGGSYTKNTGVMRYKICPKDINICLGGGIMKYNLYSGLPVLITLTA